jgi:putative peptidoglycan lipid II flippase
MVTQVFKAMYQEIRGLHEAAYILAAFTFASQILALVRDRMLAHQFGAGTELDLYYTAFRIPDLLFVVFASVLSVYVLIPFMSEATTRGGAAAARSFLSQVFTLFLMSYGALALVAFVFARPLVEFCFPGFMATDYDTLAMLLRILLLQPLLLSISNLLGVVTQLQNRFLIYAISPLLYNIGIIVGIVVFYPHVGIVGLAYGVVLGAALHLLAQIPLARQSGTAPRITHRFEWGTISAVLRISIPRALTLSLNQIALLALIGVASVMAAGSVSVFQFALNLQSVPLALIGVSYSVAAFPTLVRMLTNGERSAFVEHVATALRHIFFWSIPIIALVIVVRAQIVRVILGSGAFDWDDTRLVAAALALFVLSLAAQAVNLLIVRAFYAGGDTRTPFYVTAFSSAAALFLGIALYILFTISTAFSSVLEQMMRVRGVEGAEILALPLGYSIAMIANAIALVVIFMRRYGLRFSSFGGVLGRGLVAALTGGIMAYAVLNIVVFGIRSDTVIGIMLQGGIAGVSGMAVVIGTLYVLGSVELREAWKAIHRRMVVRSTIIPPQQSDDVVA